MKTLYLSGFVKMLVDGWAALNMMLMATIKKIGKTPDELIKLYIGLRDYGGITSEVRRVINVEVTIGSKTLPTLFFVIDGKDSYVVYLGRDWIHANCFLLSMVHQLLI